MAGMEFFEPENGIVPFEKYAKDNGMHHWLASDLATLLGYESFSIFRDVVNKAIGICMTLGVPVPENFEQVFSEGKLVDFKLSRFACMLSAMNGNPAMSQVAKAQAYFVTLAEASQKVLDAQATERILIRQEITKGEKMLHGTANASGVINYGYFHSVGYRGMYNKNFNELMRYKGVPDGKKLLDYMNATELAANLFRVTQTAEKIKNEKIKGQAALEDTAYKVGKHVRNSMLELGGSAPEDIPLSEDINEVKRVLKKSHKQLAKPQKKQKVKKNR